MTKIRKIVQFAIGFPLVVLVNVLFFGAAYLVIHGLQLSLSLISGIFPLIFIGAFVYSIFLFFKYRDNINDKSMMYAIVVGAIISGTFLCNWFEQDIKISLGSKFLPGFEVKHYERTWSDGTHEETIEIRIPKSKAFGKILSNYDETLFFLCVVSMITCVIIIKSIPVNKNSLTSFPSWLN